MRGCLKCLWLKLVPQKRDLSLCNQCLIDDLEGTKTRTKGSCLVLKASEYVDALPCISNVLFPSPLFLLLFFLRTNCEVPDTTDEAQSL